MINCFTNWQLTLDVSVHCAKMLNICFLLPFLVVHIWWKSLSLAIANSNFREADVKHTDSRSDRQSLLCAKRPPPGRILFYFIRQTLQSKIQQICLQYTTVYKVKAGKGESFVPPVKLSEPKVQESQQYCGSPNLFSMLTTCIGFGSHPPTSSTLCNHPPSAWSMLYALACTKKHRGMRKCEQVFRWILNVQLTDPQKKYLLWKCWFLIII